MQDRGAGVGDYVSVINEEREHGPRNFCRNRLPTLIGTNCMFSRRIKRNLGLKHRGTDIDLPLQKSERTRCGPLFWRPTILLCSEGGPEEERKTLP